MGFWSINKRLVLVLSLSLVVGLVYGCGETVWENTTNTALVVGSVGVSAALISLALTNQNQGGGGTTSTFESTPLDVSKIATQEVMVVFDDGTSLEVAREYVNNQVIVKLVTGKTKSDLSAILSAGYSIGGWNTETRTYQIVIPDGTTLTQALATIKGLSSTVIATTGRNFVIDTMLTPNDPYFNSRFIDDRWGFVSIEAQNTWDITTGASSVLLAVVDTGLDLDHEDFTGRIPSAYKRNFVANNTDAADDSGHGTAIAGIAAAVGNNGVYIAGMDWHASVMAIKAINSSDKADAFAVCNALNWAIDNGAKVINCSFGVYLDTANNAEDRSIGYTFVDVAQNAYENKAILIAAAGNHGRNASNFYPAALSALNNSPVIAVGGFGQAGGRWNDSNGSSNYGTVVDICAPAEKTLTTWFDGGVQANKWGTSIAAPFVSGTASLIYGLYPGSTSLGLKLMLTDDESTDTISADKAIGRKLNAWKALLRAMYYNAQALVSVSSTVEGAGIYVDGVATGKATTTEGYARIIVSSGSHTIMASKEGYAQASTSVSCTKGTNTNITLSPGASGSTQYEFGPYAPNNNTNEAVVIPAGARVYIQNLATDAGEKEGFFDGDNYGYFGVSTEVGGGRYNTIIEDGIYSDAPSYWPVYRTYYGRSSGLYNYFTTEATTGDGVHYRGNMALTADLLWAEITSQVFLGRTNYFYYHHDYNYNSPEAQSEGVGFVIKVVN